MLVVFASALSIITGGRDHGRGLFRISPGLCGARSCVLYSDLDLAESGADSAAGGAIVHSRGKRDLFGNNPILTFVTDHLHNTTCLFWAKRVSRRLCRGSPSRRPVGGSRLRKSGFPPRSSNGRVFPGQAIAYSRERGANTLRHRPLCGRIQIRRAASRASSSHISFERPNPRDSFLSRMRIASAPRASLSCSNAIFLDLNFAEQCMPVETHVASLPRLSRQSV
jgi:hypothetical protein